MHHFETIKYKNSSQTSKNKNSRRSLRFLEPKTATVVSNDIHQGYDLNSRKLRCCIIEDVMYIRPIHNVLLLVCDQSINFQYWKKVIEEKDSGFLTIVFGSKIYYQINAIVIKNARRGTFINSEYDNSLMDYHVLGIGSAAISTRFLDCSSSTGI